MLCESVVFVKCNRRGVLSWSASRRKVFKNNLGDVMVDLRKMMNCISVPMLKKLKDCCLKRKIFRPQPTGRNSDFSRNLFVLETNCKGLAEEDAKARTKKLSLCLGSFQCILKYSQLVTFCRLISCLKLKRNFKFQYKSVRKNWFWGLLSTAIQFSKSHCLVMWEFGVASGSKKPGYEFIVVSLCQAFCVNVRDGCCWMFSSV